MKRKQLETVIYSTVGVVAMFLILVAANFLAGLVKQRVDLTQEKAYTLSQGTKAILARLDTPVVIRLYCSRGESMPVVVKTYARDVEDLLDEYRQASHGLITIQKLDPEPDSDAEDSAKLDGMEGKMLPTGEKVYLGVSVSLLDQKSAVPFLAPDKEKLLEYDVSRAITRVMNPTKPTIGVMTPLLAFGQPLSMMMNGMDQHAPEPWTFITELKRDFTVKQVPMNTDKIDDSIEVLVVIHPKEISDAAQYAIDQFVLRGGKLIAFLDPLSALDTRGNSGEPSSSTMDKLLSAWGIQFDPSKVVADLDFAGRTPMGLAPGVLLLTGKAMNGDNIVTSQLDNLLLVYSGAFTGTPAEGVKEQVLLESSSNSELIDAMTAQMKDQESVTTNFKPSGTQYALAVELTGTFKTAFPNGKPGAPGEKSGEAGLKESAKEGLVVLVGDSDLLQDQVAVQEVQDQFGQRMTMVRNGNLNFGQSMVEQFSGDSNLIAMRSRASRERPFTVVEKMQADAEANSRGKIKELEMSIADTERKLADLQRGKAEGQESILSPEQQIEVQNFRQKEAAVRKELKDERKQLRRDTDALENRIKWLNIAGMPALVAISGLGLAIAKRRRTAAK